MKLEEPVKASTKSEVQSKNERGKRWEKHQMRSSSLPLTPGSSDQTFLPVKLCAAVRGVVSVSVKAKFISCH